MKCLGDDQGITPTSSCSVLTEVQSQSSMSCKYTGCSGVYGIWGGVSATEGQVHILAFKLLKRIVHYT
jgi:hypothetical protein